MLTGPTLQDWLVGVDVGTSSVKALVVDREGRLVAEAIVAYPLLHEQPGWAEFSPEACFDATVAAVREALAQRDDTAARVAAMALVAQREPAVLLDAAGRPLADCISWTDRRSQGALDDFCESFGSARYRDVTGLAPVAGSTLSTLLWLARHRPDVMAAARRILFIKDYLLYRLTGEMRSDRSTGGRSGLLDIHDCTWSTTVCDAAGIDAALLPDNGARPADVLGHLGADAARLLGLRAGTLLATGGGDDPAAALGAGAIAPGDLCAGTGTASSWRIVASDATPDPSLTTDLAPHVVDDGYIREAVISSTGSSVRWLLESIAPDLLQEATARGRNPYEHLIEGAREIAPGAGGVYFYPYLEGAAMPRFTASATGVFFGLTAGITRAHLTRAVLEGVAFQYPASVAVIRRYGVAVEHLTLVGGEARSALWNQIKADVMGIEVRAPRITGAAGLGAVMLAGLAAGIFADSAGAARLVQGADRYPPDPDQHARYRVIAADYERVHEHLDGAFRGTGRAG